MEYNIVSFSGGKDSTAMLLKMLELGYDIDKIVFADTGMEFDVMYKHIDMVEKYIQSKFDKNLSITRIKSEKDYLYWMFEHEKTRGKNKGDKGYMWMDFRSRWCTSQLKQIPIRKFFKNLIKDMDEDLEIIEFHGIAFDELDRTKKNKKNKNIVKYPLVEWEWTEEDALNYCYKLGFDWDGLYEHFDRLSCYMCPLQKISELEKVYRYYPHLWEHMKELDRENIIRYNRKFRDDYSINQLEQKFNQEEITPEKSDLINLDNKIRSDLINFLNNEKELRSIARGSRVTLKYIYDNYKVVWDKLVEIDNEKIKNTKNGNPLRKDKIPLRNMNFEVK